MKWTYPRESKEKELDFDSDPFKSISSTTKADKIKNAYCDLKERKEKRRKGDKLTSVCVTGDERRSKANIPRQAGRQGLSGLFPRKERDRAW